MSAHDINEETSLQDKNLSSALGSANKFSTNVKNFNTILTRNNLDSDVAAMISSSMQDVSSKIANIQKMLNNASKAISKEKEIASLNDEIKELKSDIQKLENQQSIGEIIDTTLLSNKKKDKEIKENKLKKLKEEINNLLK